MVDSDVGGAPHRPEVPDFAEMRRTMERDNRRHVLDGIGCLRPSCGGTLEHREEAVECSECDYQVEVYSDAQQPPTRRANTGPVLNRRKSVRDR